MEENKKKPRRVSFASEAPEQNVYEKEMDLNSFTTDDITADFTCEQTRIGKSFYDTNKEEEKENDSVMSNNTAVLDELINTQYIRTIVPEEKHVQININELLMEHGIRFLDDIVVSSTRRDTFSKSKKEVDPKNLVYYQYFLSHRIKFFEDFSEYLKVELANLNEQLKEVEINFTLKNTLLEKEDKSRLRSLKSDCRNRATVSWYELRAKKELEFNDLIIKMKNDLILEFNTKENELEQIRLKISELEQTIKNINDKIENIYTNDMSTITTQNIDKIQQDLINHEQVLEDYLTEYEKLKIDVNNKKINDESNETKFKKCQEEVEELERQFRSVNVNEGDLNEVKTEYEKMTAILGIELIKYKSDNFIFKFLDFEIALKRQNLDIFKLEDIKYTRQNSIIHDYGVLIVKKKTSYEFLEIIGFLNIINELSKEISIISVNNSVDIFLKNDELRIFVKVNDLCNFKLNTIKVLVKPNLDLVVENNGISHFYNLYKDKGCIINNLK